MKEREIIYISDSCIPSYSADSVHVMKMCQAFSSQGYQVRLVGKRTRNMVGNVSDIHTFYGVEKCFKIKLFPFRPFKFSGRLYNILLPFFCFKSYDIAYTRSIYAAFWYSFFGKSIVFEIHEPFITKGKWLKNLFHFIVKKGYVQKWVVISSPLKAHLVQECTVDSEAILVAPDGADSNESKNFIDVPVHSETRVGYVGSLYQGKGMEIILQVSRRLKNIYFHIVGGNQKQIEYWKSQLVPNQENLIFHGYKTPNESIEIMSKFDILLAPYQKEVFVKDTKQANNLSKWMSPLKIFEYMAVGRPILASDLPVIREVLDHNETALLCSPDNVEEWVSGIEKLAESPELAKKLGKAAKDVLQAAFTWKIRSKNILDFINKY